MKRLSSSRAFLDLFETREKLEQVIINYKEAIKREGKKDNVVIINGQRDINEIFNEVWTATSNLIKIPQTI